MPKPGSTKYGIRRYGAAEDAEPELVECEFLRHRKLMTKAFIHISNDKTHDSHAAQTFMNATFDWIGPDPSRHPNPDLCLSPMSSPQLCTY